MWAFAQHRFKVVGIDASDIAPSKAKEKAAKAKVKCEFIHADFFENKIIGVPWESNKLFGML